MSKILWGESMVLSFSSRTGNHRYPVQIRREGNSVIASGGAHQYQEGPGPVCQHPGYEVVMTKEDFPCEVAWGSCKGDSFTGVRTVEYRRFEKLDEFVAALGI